MFNTMPSVYCSGPSQPGGTTSGHRPAPSFFEKSTRTPSARMSTSVIEVVIGQRARSRGELRIVACDIGHMSGAAAGAFGSTGGYRPVGDDARGVAEARIADHGPCVVGS